MVESYAASAQQIPRGGPGSLVNDKAGAIRSLSRLNMAAPLSTSASATATITAAPSLSSSASASASKSSASSSSSSKGPQVHTVKVGSGGFKYEPAALTNVSVGDTVTFEFYPPDHSVVRAEFGSACVPYEYTGKNKTGFWSDTRNVSSVENVSISG